MVVTNVGIKVGALLLFAAGCIGIFVALYGAAGGKIRLSEPYTVAVKVPNAFQLVPNADVRAAGVKIGTVSSIDSDDGRVATVGIEVEADHAPIYRDARVLVRTKTLVGENYLDLEPGTPGSGTVASGTTLPLDRAQDAVQLDEILSAMDAPTRRRVSANLRNLGAGFEERGEDLNRLFGAARPTVTTGGRALAILEGQRDEVARVVKNTGDVMQAVGARAQDLRTLATSARRTSVAVAARDAQLGQLFQELPRTLRQAESSTARLGGLSERATPVAADLRVAARDLGPVARDLGPAASGARDLLRDVPGLTRVADPMLRGLATFTTAATPAVRSLDDVLREVNPALDYLKDHDREIGAFFANVGSALDTKDAVGNIARVHLLFAESSLGDFGPQAREVLDALLEAGSISELHQVRSNTYPRPGTVGAPQPFSGEYPRLAALAADGGGAG